MFGKRVCVSVSAASSRESTPRHESLGMSHPRNASLTLFQRRQPPERVTPAFRAPSRRNARSCVGTITRVRARMRSQGVRHVGNFLRRASPFTRGPQRHFTLELLLRGYPGKRKLPGKVEISCQLSLVCYSWVRPRLVVPTGRTGSLEQGWGNMRESFDWTAA